MLHLLRRATTLLTGVLLLSTGLAQAPPTLSPQKLQKLRIVGGLADLKQYTRNEAPFGTQTLARLGASRYDVDDFGTGQSSLSYLTRLPLNQLRIDQSFVRNIGIQATDGVIVQTIIGMANNLGLGVIAEGVETPAQQEFLAANGCTLYQGYLFGMPTPLSDFEALLASAQALP